MNNKYNLIIWDVDGTLLDTSEGIISAARYAIEDAGFKVPNDEALKNYIGPPIQETFAREFSIPMDKALKMAGVFRSHYKEHDLMKAKPYDGILELVAEINNLGIKQGIATNKREDYAGEIIRLFGFSQYVEIVHGSDFEGKLTKKDIIQNVIIESGIKDLNKVVMIGDTAGDQKSAEQVGIDFIAVTYGFGFKKGTDNPHIKSCDNVDELRRMLRIG